MGERCRRGHIYYIFLATCTKFSGCGRGEVDPSNFNWRMWGTGVVEMRYSIYFL